MTLDGDGCIIERFILCHENGDVGQMDVQLSWWKLQTKINTRQVDRQAGELWRLVLSILRNVP
jgi:hypothetical protein